MKIGSKITLLIAIPVVGLLGATITTLIIEGRSLAQKVDQGITEQAKSEAAKVAKSAYLLCASYDARNQRDLSRSLDVARQRVEEAGGIQIVAGDQAWKMIDPQTGAAATVTLPKLKLGAQVFSPEAATGPSALLVDDIRRLTGSYCTIFQRLNDAGDMLRVSTSVLTANGQRAIGTALAARSADGTPNPVIATVLKGEIYRGRAFVVDQWHATAYAPIWNSAHDRVIGMLYVGVGMKAATAELHDAIVGMSVGKTGYVYVLGASGDQRGHYIVSAQGKRDGENIWEAKDASGRAFIQSAIAKAIAKPKGETDFETYAWKNAGETNARVKVAAVVYFPAWDWVIGAGAYEDDFADVRNDLDHSQQSMVRWVLVVAGGVGLIATVIGLLFARRIARALRQVIENLEHGAEQVTSAANQVSSASQALAAGASEQAAALETTSATLEEISGTTTRNAKHAENARALADETHRATESGTSQMAEMDAAMNDIKASAANIAKIIKTIDEIAFQTNILALNAAVEAARAGEAGAGFSVVADEVRTLAQRAAQAARETAEKIDDAIQKSGTGAAVSAKVAESLRHIAEKTHQVNELVVEIATASKDQTQGVARVCSSVEQIDRTTQASAASAEETASAAEELNAQAMVLSENVTELLNVVGASAHVIEPAAARARTTAPSGGDLTLPPPSRSLGTGASHHRRLGLTPHSVR